MTESALVRNIQTLTDLDDALGRFAPNVQEALRTADNEIARAQEWVQQRVWHWQRQLQQAQQTLRQAQEALGRCRSQVYIDRDGRQREPDCRDQERAVHDAERLFREVEIQLRKAQKGKAQLESAVGEYRRFAGRLQHLAGSHTPRARASLKRARADLDRYLTTTSGTGALSADIPILSGFAQALVAGLPGDAEGVQGSAHWVDQGIQSISVADLPAPEGIMSEADFSKVSANDMKAGFAKLEEMRSTIESGEGANSDYWRAVDQQHGLVYANGYQRIYDAFYGDDAIRLNWDGTSYDIINGRHRIWLAQKLGMDTLPVRLITRS